MAARRIRRESLEGIGLDLFNGLRMVAQRAIAHGAKSIAKDVQDVVQEAQDRLGAFVEGAEEIARQGKRERDDDPLPAEVVTSRQTPKAKKRKRRRKS